MRKHQQKQILDVIQSLREAQEVELYADCQEGALSIGEFIEQIVGEDTQTVKLLEEYCELIYKASIGEVSLKSLIKQLILIENSVKNELKPNRVEMVFLSYKASMSDSIESIYRAAKEDPDCDAYWIPIPYYLVEPDGTHKNMQYEGQEYYKSDIECIDWQQYNIEENHPDVIFTFSPYDSFNNVSVVHPDYYCQHLRDLTDLLVYMPYFVINNNIDPLYTQCSGVIYSHKVFVQSEEVRQLYIENYKILMKDAVNKDIYGKPEEKIIALGSPKFDAIINAKSEDFTLPDNWAKLIYKPDGSKKKIVLLNTSVTALINNTSQYLKKLLYIQNKFKDQDDAVLWWRPHPLSSQSLAGMQPDYYDLYNNIVSSYKKAGWGIFDDSPDLQRALIYTNYYYGDHSSLIILCQILSKPIIIQNIDIYEKKNKNIKPLEVCEYNNIYYFTAGGLNAIFTIDKKTFDSIEYKGNFPQINPLTPKLFSSIYEYNDKIYLTPFSSNILGMYDINNNLFDNTILPEFLIKKLSVKEYNKNLNFNSSIIVNDLLYLIPATFPGIVVYNLKSAEYIIIDDWIESYNKIVIDTTRSYFINATYDKKRNCLIIAFSGANALLEVNLKTHETSIQLFENDNIGHRNIVIIDDIYWFFDVTCNALIEFNPLTKNINEYLIPDNLYVSTGKYVFRELSYQNNNLFFIPFQTSAILRFNIVTKKFDIAPNYKTISDSYIFQYSESKNNILLSDLSNELFIEYDPIATSVRETKISLSSIKNNDKLCDIIMDCIVNELVSLKNCIIYESPFKLTLESLLEKISSLEQNKWYTELLKKQNELISNSIIGLNGSSGLNILKYCKDLIINKS